MEAILRQLENRGIHVSMEEVEAVRRPGRHLGRHDIAEVLIHKGYAEDMNVSY